MVAIPAAPRHGRATSRRPASPNARLAAPTAGGRASTLGQPWSDSTVAHESAW